MRKEKDMEKKNGKIYVVANQKGGAGKTTTAAAMLSGFTRRGYRVLGIDLDPQMSLSKRVKADTEAPGTAEVIKKEIPIGETLQETGEHGWIIPANGILANIDQDLTGLKAIGKLEALKKAIRPLRKDFDFIVIDTPPAMGTLLINGLAACDEVIVPTEASLLGIQGIAQLKETVDAVEENITPGIRIGGILLVRFNPQLVLNRSLLATLQTEIAPAIGSRVYRSMVRESVAIREAEYQRMSIFAYAPHNPAVISYRTFIDELEEEEENEKVR